MSGAWLHPPLAFVFPSSLSDPKEDSALYPQSHQSMPLHMPLLWGPPPDAQGSGHDALLGAPGPAVSP